MIGIHIHDRRSLKFVLQSPFGGENFAFMSLIVFLNILVTSAGEKYRDNLQQLPQQQESDNESNITSSGL